MQTLAEIVRNFHIVAIQEIRTQDDYLIDNFLRQYVNATGRQYDRVDRPAARPTSSKEQYAFHLQHASRRADRQSVYTMHDPQDMLHREPLVAMFRARGPRPEKPSLSCWWTSTPIRTKPSRNSMPWSTSIEPCVSRRAARTTSSCSAI